MALTAKAEAVLARLREGPATTLELVRVGGVRFGARVHELRDEGHRTTTEPQGDHAVYRPEGREVMKAGRQGPKRGCGA